MKYLLSHRTSYAYASTVDSAQHIAHLRARAFAGQTVSSIVVSTPVPPRPLPLPGKAAQDRATPTAERSSPRSSSADSEPPQEQRVTS